MKFDWDLIAKLVKSYRSIDATSNLIALRRQLELWWAIKYTRPFKDPLLKEYTLEELAFEFLTYFYLDPENDPKKVEEDKKQKEADAAWIQKRLAEMKTNKKADSPKTPEPPKQPDPAPNLPEISTTFES